jgi:hypothetical protein
MIMDIKKMQSAAAALRDNNCETNYIEHINQSSPANVLELIAQREMYALQAEDFRIKYQREGARASKLQGRLDALKAPPLHEVVGTKFVDLRQIKFSGAKP